VIQLILYPKKNKVHVNQMHDTEAANVKPHLFQHRWAHPYCSWERGLNENTNGLLSQYFPKGTVLRSVTQSQVDAAVYALNHRPRKCLGYKTPHEVFNGLPLKPIKLLGDALRT
jgi:IS30 family transposase